MTDLAPPPRRDDREALRRLREDLTQSGYTVPGLVGRLGDVAARALTRDRPLAAERVIAGADDPLATLLRLFVLGDSAARAAVDAALPRTGVDGLLALGLVRADRIGVSATVDLEPHEVVDDDGTTSWWVASDHGEVALGGATLPPDHVLGIGTASLTLVDAVVPPRGGLAVDIGCGSGVQSLHLARTAGRVVATDASPRAAGFAAFNLALNGVDADVLTGDLFEPLDRLPGIDRLVANLPFVVTPRDSAVPQYAYRDGGLVGDLLSSRAVRGAPARLAPWGIAQMLVNWEVGPGEDWDAPVRAWVEAAAAGIGDDELDAWVLQRELADPAIYAETWIADGGQPDPVTARAWYEAWLDDFERRGVDGIGFGIVTLRRRPPGPGVPLRRFDDHPAPVPGPVRDAVAAVLAGHDALSACGALTAGGGVDPAALLPLHLHVAQGVTEHRTYAPGDAHPGEVTLVDGRRLGLVVRMSTELAGTVGACDGGLTVAAITSAVASILDVPEADLRARVLPAVGHLVADGLLVVS